ncbi:MAG: PDC sensor domain-containing protein [Chitinispirillaceae bacterium]|nr:PDC sensor domain-containing protein [Chitinispirillaceae bacterium]
MYFIVKLMLVSYLLLSNISNVSAQESLSPELKAKIEAKLNSLKSLGSDPVVVAEVKSYNENPPAEATNMTQEKWNELTVISPEVKFFTKNKLATYLKTKKDDVISEIFVSGANGNKVAFLSKPSNWSHKGKAKHEEPMKGKTWIGPVEVDASTGVQQVQVSFPVLDGNKPIGSIVVGISVAALK